MKPGRNVLGGVGALALLAGAALWAGRGEGSRPPAAVPVRVSSAFVEPQPPAREAAEPGPASSQALRLCGLLGLPDAKDLEEAAYTPRTPEGARLWDARESLREALARDPAAWEDVLDLLAGGKGLEPGLRVVVLARSAVNPQSEALLIRILKTKSDSGLRQLALAALAPRETVESIAALKSVAAVDPDAGVRLAALKALAQLKDTTVSPVVRSDIDQVLRQRAQEETEIQVRDPLRRMLGEAVASSSPAVAARPARTRSLISPRPAPAK
jgi:hypothetical protein